MQDLELVSLQIVNKYLFIKKNAQIQVCRRDCHCCFFYCHCLLAGILWHVAHHHHSLQVCAYELPCTAYANKFEARHLKKNMSFIGVHLFLLLCDCYTIRVRSTRRSNKNWVVYWPWWFMCLPFPFIVCRWRWFGLAKLHTATNRNTRAAIVISNHA